MSKLDKHYWERDDEAGQARGKKKRLLMKEKYKKLREHLLSEVSVKIESESICLRPTDVLKGSFFTYTNRLAGVLVKVKKTGKDHEMAKS